MSFPMVAACLLPFSTIFSIIPRAVRVIVTLKGSAGNVSVGATTLHLGTSGIIFQ
jgi:hypothetical protein